MLQRLPMVIRIEVESTAAAGGWRAVARVHDQRDGFFAPVMPVPPCTADSRERAERLAFVQLREWINRRWPHRTVPDPARKQALQRA